MDIPEIISTADVEDVDLTGASVLVTGSTSGIGMYAARVFGRLGATVVVHGRDVDAGMAVVESIESDGGSAEFIECDFSDVSVIPDFAEEVLDVTDGELDILVNNAGGYFTHSQSDDDLNYTFVVNHLSPFMLTQELLPVLKESDSYGRIVNTSSGAHRAAEFDDKQALSMKNNWSSYCHSKLLNLLTAKRLSRLEPDIRTVAIHPGAIPGSGFARNLPSFIKPVGVLLSKIPLLPVKTPEQGSVPIVFGALHQSVESGDYLTETRVVTPTDEALDESVQEEMWYLSSQLVEEYV